MTKLEKFMRILTSIDGSTKGVHIRYIYTCTCTVYMKWITPPFSDEEMATVRDIKKRALVSLGT